jgi:hypothetical protein
LKSALWLVIKVRDYLNVVKISWLSRALRHWRNIWKITIHECYLIIGILLMIQFPSILVHICIHCN